MKNTEICCADFSEILNKVQKGDFVYFDPPYVPLNETSSFTSYTKDGFDLDMQFKLRDVCDELDSMGVMFMLSNSDTKLVNELFEKWSESKRKQEWHNNVSKDISNKEQENTKKEIEKLNKEKEDSTKKIKELEDKLKEKVQFDLDNLALMLYALSNKKDALSDITKLSDEVENFKKVYKEFENYLKTNQ